MAPAVPHSYEACPQCGKKGVYTRHWQYHIGTDEKRCRYCRYQGAPYHNGKLADPATEFAELRKVIHELNTLITAFCEKWHIAVHGRTPDIEEMLKNPPLVNGSQEGKEGKD